MLTPQYLFVFTYLQFVAHPNVQQLLAAIWYDGLPGFRRKAMPGQLIQVAKLGAMFPVYSSIYLMAPNSEMGKFMKKPFVKFICHSTSYAFFLSKFRAHILISKPLNIIIFYSASGSRISAYRIFSFRIYWNTMASRGPRRLEASRTRCFSWTN